MGDVEKAPIGGVKVCTPKVKCIDGPYRPTQSWVPGILEAQPRPDDGPRSGVSESTLGSLPGGVQESSGLPVFPYQQRTMQMDSFVCQSVSSKADEAFSRVRLAKGMGMYIRFPHLRLNCRSEFGLLRPSTGAGGATHLTLPAASRRRSIWWIRMYRIFCLDARKEGDHQPRMLHWFSGSQGPWQSGVFLAWRPDQLCWNPIRSYPASKLSSLVRVASAAALAP